jgi:putative transcriptional regulator
MAADALAAVEARLDTPPPRPEAQPRPVDTTTPGLPRFLRGYRFGAWKWVAPSVRLRPIELPYPGETRVFLLKSGPGTRMLEHSHSGFEMTCVLSGAFRQDGGWFGPGDFDWGDPTVEHQPIVEPGEDCLCLVAMQGELRLKGLIGRLVQPFIRL